MWEIRRVQVLDASKYINANIVDINLSGKLVDEALQVCNAQLLFAQLSGQVELLGTKSSNDAVQLLHVTSDDHTILAQHPTVAVNTGLSTLYHCTRVHRLPTVLDGRNLLLELETFRSGLFQLSLQFHNPVYTSFQRLCIFGLYRRYRNAVLLLLLPFSKSLSTALRNQCHRQIYHY